MMITRKSVERALRSLGLRRQAGNASGHEVWVDSRGLRVLPVLRKKDVHLGHLFPLGQQLQALGICSRADFLARLRGELVRVH